MAGCHVELEGKKWFLCVFSTVVEFYGIVIYVLWQEFVILAVLAMDKYKTTIYILRQTGSDLVLLLFALLNWANRKRQQLQRRERKIPLLVLVLTAISLTRVYQLI